MSFEELVRQMRLDLMMRWGEDYEFQAACVQKINGVEQPVLRIRRKGNSVGIRSASGMCVTGFGREETDGRQRKS